METPRTHPIPIGVTRTSPHGSAVILVVVALMLMVLIGAAYLQSARLQRFPMPQPRGDMDAQVNAIVAQARHALIEDLTRDVDRFALYDYPWTNPEDHEDDPDHPNYWEVTLHDGSTAAARGGAGDTAWLAGDQPNAYVVPSAPRVWPHITNLTGVYLGYDRDGSETGDANTFILNSETGVPVEHVIDFQEGDTAEDSLHSSALLNAQFYPLVDATGDGVPDSRWTWAPIPTIDGIDYIMAVRIIDLSARVNLNVALSQVDGIDGVMDLSPEGTDAPRWSLPSEVDFGGFVDRNSEFGHRWEHMQDTGRVLAYRFDDTGVPTRVPWIDGPHNRHAFWHDWGRFTGESDDAALGYNRYGISSEYALLHRGGLSRPMELVDATIEGMQGMPVFLRTGAEESAWHDVDLSRYRFFLNDATGPEQPDPEDNEHLALFFDLEPRRQLTTRSGAATFAWPMPGEAFDSDSLGADGQHLKVDLNVADGDEIADRIAAVYSHNPTAVLPSNVASVQEFADQLAANIVGYRTPGNVPQQVGDRYSFQAVPAISEGYVQARYFFEDAEEVDEGQWEIEWERDANAGYAIEIRNPFRRPISLRNVDLWMMEWHDESTAVNWGELHGLVRHATPDDAGLRTLDLSGDGQQELVLYPDEVLILYRHSRDMVTVNDAVADHEDGLVVEEEEFTYHYANLVDLDWTAVERSELTGVPVWPNPSGQEPMPPNNVRLRLELRSLPVASGETLRYSGAEARSAPDGFTQQVSVGESTDPPTSGSAYFQHGRRGSGEMENALLVRPGSFQRYNVAPNWFETGNTDAPRNDELASLGVAAKAHTENALDPPGTAQLIIRGAPFEHVGELAHLTVLGPVTDQTIAETYITHQMFPLDATMLDFDLEMAEMMGDGHHNVPHAVVLMDQFTTLSPRHDGVDNSGDGEADSSGDNIVPGLINLNTMPQYLIAKSMPIADDSLRFELGYRIWGYRTHPEHRHAFIQMQTGMTIPEESVRTEPGIAHVGELYMLFQDLLTTGTYGSDDLTHPHPSVPPGVPGDVTWIGQTRVDFLHNDPDDHGRDGVANDREEAMMLAKWLSQVGTTRSDYFAAYVLVRGYRGGWTGEHLHEAARFIVVFERDAVDGEVVVRTLLPSGNRPYMVN